MGKLGAPAETMTLDEMEIADDPLEEYEEGAPLLGEHSESEDGTLVDDTAGTGGGDGPRFHAKWYQAKTPAAIIGLISCLLFMLVLSATLILVPMVRLIEDGVCKRYYKTTEPVEEKLCKVDEIQAELAWYGGIGAVIGAVVALTVSFPWAILSDRLGRKPILRLSYAGIISSFLWCFVVLWWADAPLPLELLLLGPLFMIVGGGVDVNIAVIHSMVADVTTERTSGFIWVSLGAVGGSVIGPAAAAKMMESISPWVPISIPIFVFTPLFYLATVFIPETFPTRHPSGKSSFTQGEPFGDALRAHLKETWRRLRESLDILNSRSLLLVLPVFLLQEPVQKAQTGILAQSISKRFGWTLAQTGYLMSLRGIVTCCVLVLLPFISILLLSPRMGRLRVPSLFRRDLLLAQFSVACLVLGLLLTGGESIGSIFAGLVVSTLAVGLGSSAKALVAYYVDAEHTSRMYTLTGMLETTGGFFAGPALAWAFGAGMRLGGGWMGLPFFLVAGLCAIVLVVLLFVREPLTQKGGLDEECGTEL